MSQINKYIYNIYNMAADLYDDGNNYNIYKNKVPPPSDKYGYGSAVRSIFPGNNPGVEYHSTLYTGINHNIRPYNIFGTHIVKKPDDFDNRQFVHRPASTPEKLGIKWKHPEKHLKFYNQS